jgi:hypothetical protein
MREALGTCQGQVLLNVGVSEVATREVLWDEREVRWFHSGLLSAVSLRDDWLCRMQ